MSLGNGDQHLMGAREQLKCKEVLRVSNGAISCGWLGSGLGKVVLLLSPKEQVAQSI